MDNLTKKCTYCGNEYSKPYTSSKLVWSKSKFCSRQCSLKVTGIKKGEPLPKEWIEKMKGREVWNKGKSHLPKELHHNWKGGKVELLCQICSTAFLVNPSRKDKAKFCSYKCKVVAQDKGISSANELVRKSKQAQEWRKSVFERDNFTCQICGIRGGRLNADHIEPFSTHEHLRFELSNGRTLCTDCHKKTPTFGGKMKRIIK